MSHFFIFKNHKNLLLKFIIFSLAFFTIDSSFFSVAYSSQPKNKISSKILKRKKNRKINKKKRNGLQKKSSVKLKDFKIKKSENLIIKEEIKKENNLDSNLEIKIENENENLSENLNEKTYEKEAEKPFVRKEDNKNLMKKNEKEEDNKKISKDEIVNKKNKLKMKTNSPEKNNIDFSDFEDNEKIDILEDDVNFEFNETKEPEKKKENVSKNKLKNQNEVNKVEEIKFDINEFLTGIELMNDEKINIKKKQTDSRKEFLSKSLEGGKGQEKKKPFYEEKIEKKEIQKDSKFDDLNGNLNDSSDNQNFSQTTIHEKEKMQRDSIEMEQKISDVFTVVKKPITPQISFSGGADIFIGSGFQKAMGKESSLIEFSSANINGKLSGEIGNVEYKFIGQTRILVTDLSMQKLYFELNTPFGSIILGNGPGPDTSYPNSSIYFADGAYGVYGSYVSLLDDNIGLQNLVFFSGYTKHATKIVFYTPRFCGYQFGIGYTPNPHHAGWEEDYKYPENDSKILGDSLFQKVKRKDNIVLGLNFEKSFFDFNFSFFLIGAKEMGTYEVTKFRNESSSGDKLTEKAMFKTENKLNDDFALQLGGVVSYKDFALGFGWINNRNSNLPLDDSAEYAYDNNTILSIKPLSLFDGMQSGKSGTSFDFGIKYSHDIFVLSIASVFASRQITQNALCESTILVFSASAKLFSGIKIFAEVDKIISSKINGNTHFKNEAKRNSEIILKKREEKTKNSGTALMVGISIAF